MIIIVKEREPDRRKMWENLTSPDGAGVTGSRFVEYEGWQPVRVVNKDGLIFREPVPAEELRQINFRKTPWGAHILGSAHTLSRGVAISILRSGNDIGLQPLERFNDRAPGNTLSKLHNVNARLVNKDMDFDGPAEQALRAEKTELLMRISLGMRRNQDYRPISDMMNIICGASVNPSKGQIDTISMLNIDVRTLLLLAGNESSILIGTRDRMPTWQRFKAPPLYEGYPAPLYHMTTPGIFFLQDIGENVKPAFPSKAVYPSDLEKLTFPEPNKTVEELLEEIFYKQRYIMNEGGVDLELKDAGDALGMVLVESRGLLFAKTRTPYGELFTGLFLDSALGMSGEMGNEYAIARRSPHELFTDSRLAALVASQYRDLVCGREIAGSRRRTPSNLGRSESHASEPEGPPQASAVRTVKENGGTSREPLKQYEGPPRPVKPHQVAGHVKRAGRKGISDRQKEAVRDFVKTTGLRVPRPKDRQTIVLPYYVPAESGKVIKDMPTFMRAKLQKTAFTGLEEPVDDQAGYIGPDNVDEIFPPKAK